MQQAKSQEEKNLITEIACKKLDISKLQKELARLESEENQAVWRRYEA
jgi:hypothetical protein